MKAFFYFCIMKYLIACLGNIGAEYANTRHNIGFMVADHLAKNLECTFTTSRLAMVSEMKYKGRQMIVIKPTTYMNLSGKAVKYWATQEKIPMENILVVCDDRRMETIGNRLDTAPPRRRRRVCKELRDNRPGFDNESIQ